MHKKMPLTLDESVYDGLYRTVGKRKINQFIEPHVLDSNLDEAYKVMAQDKEREHEAHEWCNALIVDMAI